MELLWLGWRDLYASARVLQEARRIGVNATVTEVTDLEFASAGPRLGVYENARSVVEHYDVLCVRTFHPHISEVLTLARLFREADKVVVDESLTDEGYSVSKMHDYLVLARSAIAVPRSFQLYNRSRIEAEATSLGFPCVLKGVHGSQGLHVHKVNNVHQLKRRLTQYPDGELLLQEFLQAEEDYRVIVIGYEALPIFVKRHPRPGDFRTNFAVEGEGEPQELARFPEFRTVAERAAKALRREFAGVDIRLRPSDRTPLVLEVNRRPDFDGFEDATGVNVAAAFLLYLQRKFHNDAGRHEK